MFRVGTLPELYPHLIEGWIALFTTPQRNPEREKRFFFSEEAVSADWSQLFIEKGVDLSFVLDLRLKRVGVMAEGGNGGNVRTYADSLAVPCEIVETHRGTITLEPNSGVAALLVKLPVAGIVHEAGKEFS